MKTLTIGQVATQTGVGVETIRFYERKGLIPDPPRRPSGYREYTPAVVARVRFIRRAKELGFTLREITDLLELRVDPQTTCLEMRQRAEAKIADIRDRINSLQRMEKALVELAADCRSTGPTGECPILEALETGG